MSVTATGLEALYSAAAITMVSACASVQGVTGAIDATAARAFLIEDWGGNAEPFQNVDGGLLDQLKPWFVIRSLGFKTRTIASYTPVRDGEIRIVCHLPPTDGDLASDVIRRMRNLASAMCIELEAQQSQDGKPTTVECEPGEPFIDAATGDGAGSVECIITMRWSEII